MYDKYGVRQASTTLYLLQLSLLIYMGTDFLGEKRYPVLTVGFLHFENLTYFLQHIMMCSGPFFLKVNE